jgi:dTDP-4-dehydrorhamnose reductase
MKKIYIAGAGGMLGDAFYKLLNINYELYCIDKNVTDQWQFHLDFTNKKLYENSVKDLNPDWLFHIGAETDLEICERNPTYSYLTNSSSVEYAVDIANSLNIPILYISTAGIFSSEKKFFTEDDMPLPLGYYAKSKFLGESIVIAKAKRYLICRAGWMMGGGIKKDKKFIGKLLKKIINGETTLNIVDDKLGTPTYTHDFCKKVLDLINNNHFGLFNLVCDGLTSRLEVANKMLEILNLSDKVKINKVNSSFFEDEYFAPRPDNEQLVNSNLNKLTIGKMRNWESALNEYLNDYWNYEIYNCKN